MVTTEFVLLELADALCKPQQREEVLAHCSVVETDLAFRLVRATSELIQRGRNLYRERTDKEWPLTDCISFVVMQDHGLSEALTADHHFEQAGFKALLACIPEHSARTPRRGQFHPRAAQAAANDRTQWTSSSRSGSRADSGTVMTAMVSPSA